MDGAPMIGRTGRYQSALVAPARQWRATFDRFASIVGGRVRDARVDNDLSVFELARLADVPATTLRAIEVGRPASLLVLYRIASALHIDARELMP
jgi:DNA-binding XRE family transcriptional regulator